MWLRQWLNFLLLVNGESSNGDELQTFTIFHRMHPFQFRTSACTSLLSTLSERRSGGRRNRCRIATSIHNNFFDQIVYVLKMTANKSRHQVTNSYSCLILLLNASSSYGVPLPCSSKANTAATRRLLQCDIPSIYRQHAVNSNGISWIRAEY